MIWRMRPIPVFCSVVFALCLFPSVRAEEAKPAQLAASAPFLSLEDGSRVVFLGDSITHQALYSQYLETFFYTRYPDRRIHFHNAGVSGDKAADALARFDDDVAAHDPDFVTVLLGMNDGRYEAFSEETFETYRTGVGEILSRIEKIGAKPIALSPTMFDHHQLALRKKDETFRFRDRPFDEDYNFLMAYYGAWLRETAGASRIPFVNLWGPLNDLTFAARRAQPDFSLVEDAIHPGSAGQFVMAFSILSGAQPERRMTSSISIQRRGDRWIAGKNEAISDLEVSAEADEVSFTFLAKSLPWVVPATSSSQDLKWGASAPASLGYDLTKAGHKLSAERFRVSGLAPGQYELRIDDVLVDTFPHTSLAAKVELQKYPDTPQSQQALEVARLNRDRNDLAVRPMRDLWSRVKGLRNRGDGKVFAEEYPKLLEQIASLRQKQREFEDKIYSINQPVPRRYHLKRVQ